MLAWAAPVAALQCLAKRPHTIWLVKLAGFPFPLPNPALAAARMINILAEDPAVVAGWLVPRLRWAQLAPRLPPACLLGQLACTVPSHTRFRAEHERHPGVPEPAGASKATAATASGTSPCRACCGALPPPPSGATGLCQRATLWAPAPRATSGCRRGAKAAGMRRRQQARCCLGCRSGVHLTCVVPLLTSWGPGCGTSSRSLARRCTLPRRSCTRSCSGCTARDPSLFACLGLRTHTCSTTDAL